jgi:glucosamine--fructose-6-phosphate aminotransferase (isomerizing)
MDGEGTSGIADAPSGQIVVLDGSRAGELSGLRRLAFDGRELPIDAAEFVHAEVTTRDIDRGDAPHFLLKEISEAPESFRKTIRGRIVEKDGLLCAELGARGLSDEIRSDLASGRLHKVRVIGQGTAAVAGWSCASILDELCRGKLDIDALTATELSGFQLAADMSDTLVVAVSQSGTTTDTNRTVDLARARGAQVVAIVNRRGSDLCEKADSVIYTSDGRDVEMSVASTKAFYAQVAAGVLLACAVSEAAGLGSAQRRHELLSCMRDIPSAMRQLLATRESIGDIARRYAPSKRYWAVVGNGPNSIAAHEIRIKLSELCYKSISCDITEDKKHIDLSSEPLILVCAAGLRGSTADDVAKEVAIYRAHKATPIVIAHDGSQRYSQAVAVLEVPDVDPSLAFVMSAMVGHIFGYEAARAIDDLALPLREAREIIESAVTRHRSADEVLREVRVGIRLPWERFGESLRSGQFDGHLEASTALRVASMLRILALESTPAAAVERFQAETGKIGTPAAVLDDLTESLTRAIEELTRPIDAIKHQAKTVTVGISRSDEGIMDRDLVREILAIGVSRDVLGYRSLRVLAALDPAVEDILGFTRYRIEGEAKSGAAMVTIVDRGGVSLDLKSRAEEPTLLVGTKRHVAVEHEVLVARGRADDRTVILVPEVKSGHTIGVTLLHVKFHDILEASVMRPVLQEYDRRYERLVDWVLETEGEMDESLLGRVPVADLLILPISDVANRWRSPS